MCSISRNCRCLNYALLIYLDLECEHSEHNITVWQLGTTVITTPSTVPNHLITNLIMISLHWAQGTENRVRFISSQLFDLGIRSVRMYYRVKSSTWLKKYAPSDCSISIFCDSAPRSCLSTLSLKSTKHFHLLKIFSQ